MERPEGNDDDRRRSGGCYHYLRTSTHVGELEICDVIIVSAHVELCALKYSNLKYEIKTQKYRKKKNIEKMVVINSINFLRVFLTNCSFIF